MTVTVADLKVKFSADTKDAEKGIDSLNDKIKAVGKDTSGIDALNGKLKNVGNDANPSGSGGIFGNLFSNAASVAIGNLLSSAIQNTVSAAISSAKAAIEAGIGQIQTTVKVGIEFQQDLANIKADLANLAPNLVTPEGIFDPAVAKELEGTISRIALDPKLVVGFKDASVSAQTLVRYGYNLRDLDSGMLESAVLLQNATGSTNQLAAETLAKYMAIYKLKPQDSGKAVSEITATISAGGFRDLNDYRYGLVNMTGAAQAWNVTALDMNTIMALSNKQYSSGRTGGTAIRTMFEHLVPSSDKARDAMRALNLTFFDANGQYVGFEQTIHRLRTAFAGLSQEESEKRLQEIFGATGSKEVRELINETTDAMIESTRATIDNADAVKSAGVRTDTLGAKLGNMGDQFEALRGKFFGDDLQKVFFPPIEALSQYVSDLGPAFEEAGQSAARRIKPAVDLLMGIIRTGKIPNFAAEFNSKFGKIKALKMGDLFSFDIGNIGATFQQGLANFHIGDFLKFNAAGDDTQKIQLSKYITFENDLTSQIKTLDITKYFHLVMDTGANKTHISINDFVVFDEEKGKRSLEIGKYFSIAQNTIKGTVDLQVGTFTTTIDVAVLREKINSIVTIFSGLGNISGFLTNFSGTLDVFNQSLQGLTAQGGGLVLFQQLFLGVVKGVTDGINGIDANKVAGVALSFSASVKSILDVFTTLSQIGNDNLGVATTAISSIVQSVLGLATSFTNGLDAKGIADSASKFVASFVDEIKIVLEKADVPGIAGAASNLILAISGKFKEALSGDSLSTLSTSLAGLADEIVKQLSAVLNDEKLATNLNASFQNLAEGISGGLSKVFANPDLSKSLGGGTATLGASIIRFIANEIITAAAPEIPKIDTSDLKKTFFGTGFQVEKGGLADSAVKFVDGFRKSFQDGIAKEAEKGPFFTTVEPFMAKFRAMDAAFTSWVDGLLANLKRIPGVTALFPQLNDPNEQARENARAVARGDNARVAANNNLTALQAGVPGTPIPVVLDASSIAGLGQAYTTAAASLTKPSNQPSMNEFVGKDAFLGKNAFSSGIVPVKIDTPVVVTASAPLPVSIPESAVRLGNPGTANDFSTALSQLNAQVTAMPPFEWPPMPTLEPPTIPPVKAEPIPPVQVPQPSWLSSLLNWHPTVTMPAMPSSKQILGFASGTKFAPGGWSWVGETGPELLRLPRGAQVMSNTNSMDAIGQLAEGNYQGGPYLGMPSRPMPPIGSPELGPIAKSLTSIDKSSAVTAINSKSAATKATIKAPMSDAERALARQKAAVAQQGQPANSQFANLLKAQQQMGREIAESFQGTVEEFKSFLQSVPGLFKTSSVTQGDMDAAKAGTYKEKVDEKVRQLQDLADNGVSYAGLNVQEFKDALGRIGVKASDDLKTLTSQVKSAWDDQSLFSDKQNLSLLNLGAVKDTMAQQAQQKAGAANIMELFGIQPDQVQAQAVTAGQTARTGLVQGLTGAGAAGATGAPAVDLGAILLGGAGTSITPESVAPLAQNFMSAFASALSGGGKDNKDKDKAGIDFGAVIIGALNTSLTDSKAFDSTSQALLKAIADAMGRVVGDTVDLLGGIAKAMDTQIGTKSAIDKFLNIGGKIAKILKQGIGDYFATADIAADVAASVNPPSATTSVGQNANGTSFWGGGLTWVGERGAELIAPPRGSQIYSHEDSLALAGAGQTAQRSIIQENHYHIENKLDIHAVARQVSKELRYQVG